MELQLQHQSFVLCLIPCTHLCFKPLRYAALLLPDGGETMFVEETPIGLMRICEPMRLLTCAGYLCARAASFTISLEPGNSHEPVAICLWCLPGLGNTLASTCLSYSVISCQKPQWLLLTLSWDMACIYACKCIHPFNLCKVFV